MRVSVEPLIRCLWFVQVLINAKKMRAEYTLKTAWENSGRLTYE